MKSIREIIVKKDVVDLKGMTIRKGTKLFVIKEGSLHPILKNRIFLVRVDNGTGYLDLCPETCVRSNEIE